MGKRFAHVSDHALIRYLDRVLGLKHKMVEYLLEKDDGMLRQACEAGASRIVIDGVEYRIKNGNVQTVLLADKGAV